MPTVSIAPGVELHLDVTQAQRLLDQLQDVLGDESTQLSVLDDDHPLWARHTGGPGHSGLEWSNSDRQLAHAFYAQVRGKGKIFFDLLLDQPGRQLAVDDLIAASDGAFPSSYSVAGAINGLRLAHEASGRRWPFYWWAGTPTRYAVKPSVAQLFNAARSELGR